MMKLDAGTDEANPGKNPTPVSRLWQQVTFTTSRGIKVTERDGSGGPELLSDVGIGGGGIQNQLSPLRGKIFV